MPDLLRDQLQSALGSACTLERELGGGGMSRVFVAEETARGRRVVVKVHALGGRPNSARRTLAKLRVVSASDANGALSFAEALIFVALDQPGSAFPVFRPDVERLRFVGVRSAAASLRFAPPRADPR